MGEEDVCLAPTTSDLPDNYEVGDDWEAGPDPDTTSYCSPWVVATVKHEAVASPQGRVAERFAARMGWAAAGYLQDELPT